MIICSVSFALATHGKGNGPRTGPQPMGIGTMLAPETNATSADAAGERIR